MVISFYHRGTYVLLQDGATDQVEVVTGPNYDAIYMASGTIEVWKTEADKVRIVYTSSPIPTALFGETREFRFEGKREKWTMADYIEVYNMVNLQPLYGTTITAYMYN